MAAFIWGEGTLAQIVKGRALKLSSCSVVNAPAPVPPPPLPEAVPEAVVESSSGWAKSFVATPLLGGGDPNFQSRVSDLLKLGDEM
jgi:hypothetical protein